MLNLHPEKRVSIILPNRNRALKEVLSSASQEELVQLSRGKDLASILESLLRGSAQDTKQNGVLLNLLKSSPTLQNLGSLTTTIKELLTTLSQEQISLPVEKQLKNFLSDISNMTPKDLQKKFADSGIFLENKLKNIEQLAQTPKELLTHDLKALLLKAHEEISALPNANSDLLKQVDKLLLQIDYHQLLSHLADTSSLYLPYSWDMLEEGNITMKKSKAEKFFTDIELQLKEYGLLKLRLGLFEQKQLNINISTESQKLKELLQQNIPQLKEQLFDIGLMPSSIRFLDEKSDLTEAYDSTYGNLDAGFEVKV